MVCQRCGQPLQQGSMHCSNCGYQQQKLITTKLPSVLCPVCQTSVPHGQQCPKCASSITINIGSPSLLTNITPPIEYQNPSIGNIYTALNSDENPYADWGKLVYDDSKKLMWPTGNFIKQISEDNWGVVRRTTGFSGEYVGRYRLTVIDHNFPIIPFAQDEAFLTIGKQNKAASPLLLKDFTFQVQMQMQNSFLAAGGLVFRAASPQSYYCFFIKGQKAILSTENGNPFFEKSIPINPENSNLLAVVVQDYRIYLYINLELIEKIDDLKILNAGKLGLFMQCLNNVGKTSVDFSLAKVWAKDI